MPSTTTPSPYLLLTDQNIGSLCAPTTADKFHIDLKTINLHSNQLRCLDIDVEIIKNIANNALIERRKRKDDFRDDNSSNDIAFKPIPIMTPSMKSKPKSSSKTKRLRLPCFPVLNSLNLSSNDLSGAANVNNPNLTTASLLSLCPNLCELNLAANNLCSVSPILTTTTILPNLRELELSYNNLESLENLPLSTPNLVVLHCKSNKLSTLHDSVLALSGMASLESVDYSGDGNSVRNVEGYHDLICSVVKQLKMLDGRDVIMR